MAALYTVEIHRNEIPMSLINAIVFGARHVVLSKLQEDLLADQKITTHLHHRAYDTLKAFVDQQMASMSTAEAATALGEIKGLDNMVLSLEIYGDVSADFLLKEIVSAQVYKVLSPVTAALNADDATPSSVSAAVLDIDRMKISRSVEEAVMNGENATTL